MTHWYVIWLFHTSNTRLRVTWLIRMCHDSSPCAMTHSCEIRLFHTKNTRAERYQYIKIDKPTNRQYHLLVKGNERTRACVRVSFGTYAPTRTDRQTDTDIDTAIDTDTNADIVPDTGTGTGTGTDTRHRHRDRDRDRDRNRDKDRNRDRDRDIDTETDVDTRTLTHTSWKANPISIAGKWGRNPLYSLNCNTLQHMHAATHTQHLECKNYWHTSIWNKSQP